MLLLLFQSAALNNYSLTADSGTLSISGSDATLTYTPVAAASVPQTGGAVLAGGGRRRASGSWHRIDDEKTPQERAAYDAELDRRLDEEARQRAIEAADAAEAYRLANLRHFTLHASGAELRITKKRSHKLIVDRSMRAGERFLHIRPSAAKLTRTVIFHAEGGTMGIAGGEIEMTQRGVLENLRHAQEQLKRLKDDHEAITLLLLAA